MLSRIPTALRMMFLNIMLSGAAFISGVVLARALAPEGRGEFAALMLWTVTLSNLALCGVHVELSRRAAQAPDLVRAYYRQGYLMVLLSSVAGVGVFLGLIMLGSQLTETQNVTNLLIASLIIPASALNAVQVQVELGRGKFGTFNFIRGSFVLITLATALIAWWIGFLDVQSYLIAYVGGATLSALISYGVIASDLPHRTADKQPGGLGELFKASRYYGLSTMFTALAMQTDKFLISALFSLRDMGLYAVASALAQIQHMAGEALSQMFFARMSLITDPDSVDRDWLSTRLRQTILIYLVICLGSLAVLPPLLTVIYGDEYRDAWLLLVILLPALAIKGMNRPFEEVFRGLGKPKLAMASLIITTIIMAVTTILAWQMDDIMLAALGSGLGNGVGLLACAVLLKTHLQIGLRQSLLPTLRDGIWIVDRLKHVVAR